ncbi:MAG: thioredoxin family protein [bacterium]|nr:thioredoxin family protein [bacterium]
MKLTYFLTMVLGTSITLTSCIANEPKQPNESKKTTQTTDFDQFKGSVVTLNQLAQKFNSPDEAFSAAIQSDSVVVDFYAEWCGPCQQMGSYLPAVASKFPNVLFIKVNIEKFPTITNQYGIRSIPTIIFFKKGSLVKRNVGLLSERALSDLVSTTF